MKLNHNSRTLDGDFGLTKQRQDDIFKLICKTHNSCNADSEFLEKIWESKELTEQEKIYAIFTSGQFDEHMKQEHLASHFGSQKAPDGLLAGIAVHAGFALFLGSIRKWGLEQALDKLRAAVGEEQDNMEAYDECLEITQMIRDNMRRPQEE